MDSTQVTALVPVVENALPPRAEYARVGGGL
jgi:hypothetical protein